MKFVALVSGGKDSLYSIYKCLQYGHELVCIANLHPEEKEKYEVDSFMFQTIGHHMISSIAECLGVPLVQGKFSGKSIQKTINYTNQLKHEDDEVEDMFKLLSDVKNKFPEVNAVSCGAILSDYQRFRVENVCSRLDLVSFGFLWRKDQTELLNEIVEADFNVILIKTASMGLYPKKHLGKTLKELQQEFEKLHQKFQLNVCGEGGEYESLVLDCPIYKSRIVIDEAQIVEDGDFYAPVGHYLINKFHLEKKEEFQIMKPNSEIGEIYINKSKNEKVPEEKGHIQIEFNDDYIIGSTMDSPHFLFQKIIETTKKKFIHNVITIKSLKDYSLINSIYIQYFKEMDPPSRVFIENDDIDYLSIECYLSENETKVLHVQSISEWAPASIGPYSQAVSVDKIVRVAGQIGLIPSTMKLSQNEDVQCLKNIENILNAMNTSSTNIFKINIYYDINKLKYEDIKMNIKTKFTPVLNIIGCSSLPRGSMIEYQVFASNNIDLCNEYEIKIENFHLKKFDNFETLLEFKKKIKLIRIIGDYKKCLEMKDIILKSTKSLISILPNKHKPLCFELEY